MYSYFNLKEAESEEDFRAWQNRGEETGPPAAFTVGEGQQRVPVWDETLELVGLVLMLKAETDEFQMVFSESAAQIQSKTNQV